MSSDEFFFSLECSSQSAPVKLLGELAARVLNQLGASGAVLPEVEKALRKAAASGGGGVNRCEVQFSVHGGKLDILVSCNGECIWQTAHAIS